VLTCNKCLVVVVVVVVESMLSTYV